MFNKFTRRITVEDSLSALQIERDILKEISYLELEYLNNERGSKPYFNWSLVKSRMNNRLGYPVNSDTSTLELIQDTFVHIARQYQPHPSRKGNFCFTLDNSQFSFLLTIKRLIGKL